MTHSMASREMIDEILLWKPFGILVINITNRHTWKASEVKKLQQLLKSMFCTKWQQSST